MGIKIKEAGLEDKDLVFEITKQAFQDYLGPAFSSLVPALQESKVEVKNDIKTKQVLIAYVDNQAAGSVRFYAIGDKEYRLSRLGVLNKFSGKNVGKRLIQAVEERAAKAAAERVSLISAYQKKKLLHFYQHLGYEVKEVREDEDYTRVKLVKRINDK